MDRQIDKQIDWTDRLDIDRLDRQIRHRQIDYLEIIKKKKHISCDSVTVMILAKKNNVNSKYTTDVIKKQQKGGIQEFLKKWTGLEEREIRQKSGVF